MIHPKRLSIFLVDLPLREPFATSFGEERVRRALLVAIDTDDLTGWGECVAGAGPWYSAETADTARHVIADFFIPFLRKAKISHPTELRKILSPIRGHQMAKAALEAAFWDIHAQMEGVPLWRALGGVRDEIPAGVSVGIQPNIPSLLEKVSCYVAQGYQRIKLKVKPGYDLEVVAAVRERFPDIRLSVDANAAYRFDDFDHLREFDCFNLMMVEQPLHYDDLVAHSRLSKEMRTPICLDESITSPERAWEAAELGSCRIINVKQGRVGGLAAALSIHDLAKERDIPLWCGGMLETGVGRALNVALATLPGFSLPHDISATERYYYRDIADPPFQLTERGTIPVPNRPGLGVEVNLDELRRTIVGAWSWRL